MACESGTGGFSEPGDRDPVQPPGLWLVLVAAIALGSLGYAVYPRQGTEQAGPMVGGGGPSEHKSRRRAAGQVRSGGRGGNFRFDQSCYGLAATRITDGYANLTVSPTTDWSIMALSSARSSAAGNDIEIRASRSTGT